MRKSRSPHPPLRGEVAHIAATQGLTRLEAEELWERQNNYLEFWEDATYLVKVLRGDTPYMPEGVDSDVAQIMIRRRDGKVVTNHWQDFQRIKTEILGRYWEAVELYPSEVRHYDTSNTYHLWCREGGFLFGYPIGYLNATNPPR